MNMNDWLIQNKINFKTDVELSRHSWFRTGGKARMIIFPDTLDRFILVVRGLCEREARFRVIGETSNMLFLDDATYGIFVSTLNLQTIEFDREKGEIHADCGAKLPELARRALLESASGFAAMEGIPGTIGGAIFMNAAAYGDSIHLVLKAVEVITMEGELLTMPAADLDFSYRNSVFRDGRCKHIILKGIFHLREGDVQKLSHKMELVHAKRHKYHEYNYPNLGSVFSGSVYRGLAKRDRVYWLISSLYYIFNYRFKIFRRESPLNRKWLNDYTIKRFGISYEKQPFSDKTMNTIVNNGQGSSVYVKYIREIESLIKDEVPIENEIVDGF